MSERSNIVKMKGNPVTLTGNELKVGDTAPDFTVLNGDLKAARLSDFSGKTVVVVSVPSIDTPVCETETRRFNELAGKMSDDVVIMTISMDLPFAQKRWCAAEGVDKVRMFSDYKDRDFGEKFGVMIKELGLLARTIFIVDPDGKVQYVQYVEETTTEPDYDDALDAIKKISGK